MIHTTTTAFSLLLTAVLAGSPRDLGAQVVDRREASWSLQPTGSLGGSILEFDYGGDQAFRGYALRGGVSLHSFLDLATLVERWPDLAGRDGWAIQAEGAYYPLRRPVVAPYVLLAVGHFAVSSRSGSPNSGIGGLATSLALGVQTRIWSGFGLRLEGVVRSDAGAGDDELRGFVTYGGNRSPAPSGVPPARAAVVLYGMVPLSGPWRFVEPGYAVKFVTPVSLQQGAAMTVALFHWQIPSAALPGAYEWDTRAVFVMPGWQWSGKEPLAWLYLRGGPAVSVMLEGPDKGTRAGLHFDVGASGHVVFVPVTASVGWLWLVRNAPGGALTPGTDQRGLLVSAGVGF